MADPNNFDQIVADAQDIGFFGENNNQAGQDFDFQGGLGLADLFGQTLFSQQQAGLDQQAFRNFQQQQELAQGTLMDRINAIQSNPFLQDLRTQGADLANLQTTNPNRALQLQQANRLQEQTLQKINADLAARGLGGGSGEEASTKAQVGRTFADFVQQQNVFDQQQGRQMQQQAFQLEQNALQGLLQQLAALQAKQPAFRQRAGGNALGTLVGAGAGAFLGGGPGGAAIGGSLGGSIGSLF